MPLFGSLHQVLVNVCGILYYIWYENGSFQPAARSVRSQSHLFEPPPADFIARIRDELTATLARVREAATLPWKDLTAATISMPRA
jgi:hypothetical protein